ncbi:MAG TPA: cytochrome c oxidase assembly protein [Actinoallomurus sp.]|nr:cytochrome c oxidase assembly protein [Actinoallomurus sp.]
MNMPMPTAPLAPLTWSRAFTTWRFAPITTAVLLVALLLYLGAVVAVRRRGERWAVARAGCFAAGLGVVAAAIMGSPGVYGDGGLFWVHMIQHLMLIMAAPWLLCLGHPVTLLLRITARFEAVRRSPVTAVAASPLTGLAVYICVLFGVHLSGFMDAMMGSPVLMVVEHGLYLGGGYLYFSRLLTADSPYRPLVYPLRLFSLFMGMSADTIVGIVLLQAPDPPFPSYARMHPAWGPGPLTDIHDGGAVMWIGGDGLMFVMMVVVGAMWMLDRSPDARRAGAFLESARQSALAGTGHERPGGETDREQLRTSDDVDEDETALAAYNELLTRMNRPEAR